MARSTLSDPERYKILVEWNDTGADFPDTLCLHQLFEKQVGDKPDAIALLYRDEALSYSALDRRANRLANYLQGRGVGVESLVGICVERSVEMVVAILGILKAGAAYVPIDPAYPKDRIRFMLTDTQVDALLTQSHLHNELPPIDAPILYLDSEWNQVAQAPATAPRREVRPENLCYVIYTSGSTGTPKGIELRHRGVVNNIHDLNTRFGVDNDARTLAISALGFDMCVYEVLGTLAAGGAIVMPEQWGLKDPAHWSDLIHRHNVSLWNSAPALLEILVDYIEARPNLQPLPIRLVIQGGDWEPVTLPDRLRALAPGAQVVVLGGATEASIHSIVYPVGDVDPSWQSIPYGKPMRNQSAYILDQDLQPLPVGEAGELYLGGIGLARGYFARPELTAEKFIPHPFSNDPQARLYRTGDLARWMADGNIELVGRLDFQVKIRGHRIELGEIVSRLREHQDVQEAVVVMREDEAGEKRLAAYIVPDPSREQEHDGDTEDVQQIGQWAEVYDQTYAGVSHSGQDLNFIGWNSSYTGLPFTDEELEEMLGQTVRRLLDLKPERVMEIGCGTGLILLNVAPHVREYDAADLSAVAVGALRSKLEADRGRFGHVRLKQATADDFSDCREAHYDTLILNSVLQHFPHIGYLDEVIDGALGALRPGGTLFIGDVRSLPLLDCFHTSIECFAADDCLPISKLCQRIQRRARDEKELVIDPEYFLTLGERNPNISHAAVVLKRGRHHNEFNKYHYDVYVQVGAASAEPPQVTRLRWGRDIKQLNDIRQQLKNNAAPIVRITGIANARVSDDVHLQHTLAELDAGASVSDLREALSSPRHSDSIDPDAIWKLEDELPYRIEICIAKADSEGSFDAVFVHRDRAADLPMLDALCASDDRTLRRKSNRFYARQPYRPGSDSGLIPALRRKLSESLPEYMVPHDFILLDQLPLTPNGKIDRRALPIPDRGRPELEERYMAPVSRLQEALALIWSEVLGIERIGIRDNFFSLGGHSLKATQIVSRINETFPIRISLQQLFDGKTIEGLADKLDDLAAGAQLDIQAIASAFIELSSMSDEQIQAMLSSQAR